MLIGKQGHDDHLHEPRCLKFEDDELPRAALILHPLSQSERREVTERIRQEVTKAACHLLKEEQATKSRLQLVHVKAMSLAALGIFALGVAMVYLRTVMVPFVLATFLFFLYEPLLELLVVPGDSLRRALPERLVKRWDRNRNVPSMSSAVESFKVGGPQLTPESLLSKAIGHTWQTISVLICVFFCLGIVGLIGYFLIVALVEFPWEKYLNSERMQVLLTYFPELAQDILMLKASSILLWFLQGPIFSALDVTFNIITQTFLTLMFFGFFLASDAMMLRSGNQGLRGLGRKIRRPVRRFIRIKTFMAVTVSILVGILYWRLKVDLYFVFAICTFVLWYVPQVGNVIAVLAPTPLVLLDPSKTGLDLILVFAIPFGLHMFAINFLEPRLLASSLDLHTIVVLLSMAFWTTIWGPVGAILSAPLTAVVRLILIEIDHPYTRPFVHLLKGNMGELVKMRRRPSHELDASNSSKDTAHSAQRSRTLDQDTVRSIASPNSINTPAAADQSLSGSARFEGGLALPRNVEGERAPMESLA